MQPDAPQNPPAPQVPLSNAAPSPQAPPSVPSAAVPSLNEQVSAQARQLLTQYQQNPYALSEAFQQLKSQYLADQFHVKPNAVED